jgi:phage shock protein A
MNILKRLFKIGQAEAHSAIDQLENPIKMTEQGIRDMKADLDKALHALAEVKAMAIRAQNEYETETQKASDYENKAMLILQKGQKGEMDGAEADRLATEALTKKNNSVEQAARAKKDKDQFDKNIMNLDGTVKQLRTTVSKWENELNTLKARVKVSSATKNLNKQLSQIDGTGTVSMLERMKEKVAEEEALAQSYGEIANESKSIDEEIDKALSDGGSAKASEDLADLKAKLGL